VALEAEAQLVKRAVHANLLDAQKGVAALLVYAQLQRQGASLSFQDFLVSQNLLTRMALRALEETPAEGIETVSELGDYELVSQIGEGRYGVVFKALQKSLNRMVALKIFSAEAASGQAALERLRQEARATAKLAHPQIVMAIDVGFAQGLNYFAMELVEGGSVRSKLESSQEPLDERTALEITRQVAEGLNAAHAAGLVHRDVKPDNILLTREGVAKLADLGISQLRTGGSGEEKGHFWATPEYAAPEIISGTAENDPRSDIYSLGATLFEMLSGRPPFAAETPEKILALHLHTPAPDVRTVRPDVSAAAAELAAKMLVKDPAGRFQDAAAVARAAARILNPPAQALNQPPLHLHRDSQRRAISHRLRRRRR
jgi:serine/threonine-protein kinase